MSGLAGVKVLVTRPEGQAQGLIEALAAQGAIPVHFPAVAIVAPRDTARLDALLARMADFQWAIFISPNAVARAAALMHAQARPWPPQLRLAAIGRGSARELKRLGFGDVLVPEGRFDSESLLALKPFADVSGQKIVIFRGEGGREVLGDTLTARGGAVEYAECYRRAAPSADVATLLRVWARQGIDVVTLTSTEGLHHLYEALGQVGRRWLARTPLVVASARIAEACRALGLEGPIQIAAGADDAALLTAVRAWRAAENPL